MLNILSSESKKTIMIIYVIEAKPGGLEVIVLDLEAEGCSNPAWVEKSFRSLVH